MRNPGKVRGFALCMKRFKSLVKHSCMDIMPSMNLESTKNSEKIGGLCDVKWI